MIFKCKNCGGNTVYNPDKEGMYCPQCESMDSHEQVNGGNLQSCPNCGAPVEAKEYLSAIQCGHCGNYLIFEERIEGIYRPHTILPFKISKETAKEKMEKEFARKAFLPASFLSAKTLQNLQGRYVPFWMYDYNVHMVFSGRGTKIRTWESGDTRYTETSVYAVERDMAASFDKVPVDASTSMEDDVMDLMEPYHYEGLVDFAAQYMSGFLGEVYNEDADSLEARAGQKVINDSKTLLHSTIGQYNTLQTEREDITRQRTKSDFALFPVWKYEYEYQGKNYSYFVNGQTGKVIGKTPVSVGKAFAYTGTIFASCCLIMTFLKIILGVL